MKISVVETVQRLVELGDRIRSGTLLTRKEVNTLVRSIWELSDRVEWLERNHSILESAWLAFIDLDSSSKEKEEAQEAIEDALAYEQH